MSYFFIFNSSEESCLSAETGPIKSIKKVNKFLIHLKLKLSTPASNKKDHWFNITTVRVELVYVNCTESADSCALPHQPSNDMVAYRESSSHMIS